LEAAVSTSTDRVIASPIELDVLLSAQVGIAWAGETGEQKRLGWWRTDLVSEFGGYDLFQRLLPNTWDWAALQGAREAARRQDAALRSRASDPDQIVSLFRLGFELDEQVDERLMEHKRSGDAPNVALPSLDGLFSESFSTANFQAWIESHGESAYSSAPIGRLLKGPPPAELTLLVRRLVAALAPLPDAYPLPHYRHQTSRRQGRAHA